VSAILLQALSKQVKEVQLEKTKVEHRMHQMEVIARATQEQVCLLFLTQKKFSWQNTKIFGPKNCCLKTFLQKSIQIYLP
jgi:hypothetical protein